MHDLKLGILSTVPLVPGVVAFGLVYGIMARQVGFSPWEAWAMSLIVHAGSAQFAAVGIWDAASVPTIVLTTLIINLRHLLMGASAAPYLRGLSPAWKGFLALWMSDESYALAIARYRGGQGSQHYFLGANVATYATWTTSGLVGALLGSAIPDPGQYGLDLVFPLAFLGLLTAFLNDWTDVIAAVAAGSLALLSAMLLPGKWNIIVASLLGSGLGLLFDEVTEIWKKS